MTLHPYTVICPRCSSPAPFTHGRYFCSGCWWCEWCAGTCNGTTATGCRGPEGEAGTRNMTPWEKEATEKFLDSLFPLERSDHSPWHCPSCGEWETTHRVEPTWWESSYKGWEKVMECPRCSHRYPL